MEGGRYDNAEKQRTIYHKGKAKERLSTARTSGDILVKNSRQGHLKWEQKWWMWASQQATNLDSPSLLLQEKESICLSFIWSRRQWLHLGPDRGLKLNIYTFFPSAEPESDCIPFNARTEKFGRTVDNKGTFQTFIYKATGAKGNKNLGASFFLLLYIWKAFNKENKCLSKTKMSLSGNYSVLHQSCQRCFRKATTFFQLC